MNNWQTKKLGEVCEYISRGVSPKYINEGGILVLNQKCIRNHKVDYAFARMHNVDCRKIDSKKIIKDGDVLINSTGVGTLGRVAQVKNINNVVTVDSHVTIVRPVKDLFHDEYFGYVMIFVEDILKDSGDGASGQIELSRNKLKEEIKIVFTENISEQKRIVKILDEVFENIEKTKENAKKNLQNSRELFESYLQGVFKNSSKNWEEKKLGDISYIKSGGTPLRSKREYWGGNIAWYSSGELNDLYTKEPQRYINNLSIENSNAKIFQKGSLLIGMYDTAALKMSILDRDAAFNQAIAGIKPTHDVDLVFVLHSINAIKPQLLNQRRGVRQKNLNLEKIKNIKLLMPSLAEQKSIVKKLDALSAETKKLEEIYKNKIADLDELKKSVLKKAFAGKL